MVKFSKRKVGVSRQFAFRAALYRRLVRKTSTPEELSRLRFDRNALVEMYKYESTGKSERSYEAMKKDNGYALGKWIRDLQVSMMVEDVEKGHSAKIEFLDTPLNRLHNKPVLDKVRVKEPFMRAVIVVPNTANKGQWKNVFVGLSF